MNTDVEIYSSNESTAKTKQFFLIIKMLTGKILVYFIVPIYNGYFHDKFRWKCIKYLRYKSKYKIFKFRYSNNILSSEKVD